MLDFATNFKAPLLGHRSLPSHCGLDQVGLSHADILRSILRHACARFSTVPLPKFIEASTSSSKSVSGNKSGEFSIRRQKVYVLFGGDTSERQVSLISGTNVWLNLRACSDVSLFSHIPIAALCFCDQLVV